MTTSDRFLQGASGFDPVGYGLPSAEEVAQIAGAYFPEFGNNEGYAPALFPESEIAPSASLYGVDGDLQGTDKGKPAYEATAYEKSKYIGDYSLAQIRADFPILSERVDGGRQLVWLDNAATTQRPTQVIERIKYFYEHENSNVHRGAHTLAARSTDAYEDARDKIAKYLGAPSKDNIVFVRGTTEGVNLVAHSYVKQLLSPGDEIVLTILEHHANIVPWQIIAQETGAVLKVAPVDETGQIILSEYTKQFTSRTKFAAAAHVANALGTVTPIAEMIQIAHGFGVPILVDGAQSVSHMPVNVTAIDADFFVFSGHKIFGPTGIGALYGKEELLEAAKPYQGGGNMIADVTFERTIYHKAPEKFEAGTGNIADGVGLGAAIDYVSRIGIHNIAAYEHELLEYATAELKKIPGLHLIGTAFTKASVLSFVLDGYGVEEVGQHLSNAGIAVRAGHHCAQPILRRFGLEGTVRPSLAFYNTPAEIDYLAATIKGLVKS
ncbi:MAG: cysteine desulfurase [Clostridiales Family XIII bacterium]|jgi:cysteine desulfurase/selenocysteine lyase|nr:cysteine desulfurase [Clostridiales Family XIII bacterium]